MDFTLYNETRHTFFLYDRIEDFQHYLLLRSTEAEKRAGKEKKEGERNETKMKPG